MKLKLINLQVILFIFSFGLKDADAKAKKSKISNKNSKEDFGSSSNSHPTLFEINLPYRLDFFAEMKLTSIFPRKFMYSLKDYQKTKSEGKPIISMPNCSSGTLSLGCVHITSKKQLEILLKMMDDLAKRVFRTGLNEATAGGNFRLPMKRLGIDPMTRYVYTKFDSNYPTDSHSRFVTFIKSLFFRLAKSNLVYEIYDDIKSDQLILGRVESLDSIDLSAFKNLFDEFMVGFVTFSKVMVVPAGSHSEKMRSTFYFDHMSHEPIIGIENTVEEEEEVEVGESAKKS